MSNQENALLYGAITTADGRRHAARVAVRAEAAERRAALHAENEWILSGQLECAKAELRRLGKSDADISRLLGSSRLI